MALTEHSTTPRTGRPAPRRSSNQGSVTPRDPLSGVTPTAEGEATDWTLFVGVILAFAFVREVLRQIRKSPVIVVFSRVDRSEAFFSGAVMVRVLQRIGAGVLGIGPGGG